MKSRGMALATSIAMMAQSFGQADNVKYIRNPGALDETEYAKVPHVSFNYPNKKGIGNNQRKRRKLIRQNPSLLRSKKYKRSK